MRIYRVVGFYPLYEGAEFHQYITAKNKREAKKIFWKLATFPEKLVSINRDKFCKKVLEKRGK